MSNYPTSPDEYVRPTNKLSDEHKAQLDKTCKDMNCEQMNHAANHIHNVTDKLRKHAEKEITMEDYKKAKKRGNVDDTDNDGM